jgi:hypothetical protein
MSETPKRVEPPVNAALPPQEICDQFPSIERSALSKHLQGLRAKRGK